MDRRNQCKAEYPGFIGRDGLAVVLVSEEERPNRETSLSKWESHAGRSRRVHYEQGFYSFKDDDSIPIHNLWDRKSLVPSHLEDSGQLHHLYQM